MSSSHNPDPADTGAEEGERKGWEGSDVTQAEIDWLVQTRRILEGVICRVPGDEAEPDLQPSERVVFVAHFERGFGLLASPFFRAFLNKFHLQPHHLPANAITTLSAYVSFSEGYLGLWPTVDPWAKYFQLRQQIILDTENRHLPKRMTACGAATIVPRRSSIFPRIHGLESCRKWQRTFFYVKNPDNNNLLNLPTFTLGAPTEQHN